MISRINAVAWEGVDIDCNGYRGIVEVKLFWLGEMDDAGNWEGECGWVGDDGHGNYISPRQAVYREITYDLIDRFKGVGNVPQFDDDELEFCHDDLDLSPPTLEETAYRGFEDYFNFVDELNKPINA